MLLGVPSNQHFLVECLQSPAFAQGQTIHTSFVQQYMGHCLAAPPVASARTLAFAALALVAGDPAHGLLQRTPVPLQLRAGTQTWQAQVQATQAGWQISLTDAAEPAGAPPRVLHLRDLRWLDAEHRLFQVECDGVVEKAIAVAHGLALELFHAGQAWHIEQPDAHKSTEAAQGGGSITAPLTGRVAAVLVELGQTVTEGQPLAVLEAMKMEHSLTSPIAGRVVELHATPNAQATKGSLLLRIEELA